MQTKDGIVIKPEQTRDKGDEEHLFFKRIFLDNPDKPLNDEEICLRKFLPTYLGQYEHENGNENNQNDNGTVMCWSLQWYCST